MFLMILLACTGKDTTADDTGDTGGGTVDTFPCDADYFPVDFTTRSYDYTEYSGRFAQVTGNGVRNLAFQSLLEDVLGTDTTDTAAAALEGCVFNQVVPLGLGTAYTVYGIDEQWVYVLGDGDRDETGADVFHLYETPIPLLPLEPEDGWQDFVTSDYSHPDFDSDLQAGVDGTVLNSASSLTIASGTYDDLLEMSWQWTLMDGQERLRLDLDITAHFHPDDGLIRQTWYDALEDTSGLIEFQGY